MIEHDRNAREIAKQSKKPAQNERIIMMMMMMMLRTF